MREKERLVAWCRPAKGVAGGIADDIGLGFDDASCESACGMIVNKSFAHEKASELSSIEWEFGSTESTNAHRKMIAPNRKEAPVVEKRQIAK